MVSELRDSTNHGLVSVTGWRSNAPASTPFLARIALTAGTA